MSKLLLQCFENFGGGKCPLPGCAPAPSRLIHKMWGGVGAAKE